MIFKSPQHFCNQQWTFIVEIDSTVATACPYPNDITKQNHFSTLVGWDYKMLHFILTGFINGLAS